MTVTPSWEYTTLRDQTRREWTNSVAQKIDTRTTSTIENTYLGQLKPSDRYYDSNYPDWYAIKSVVTVTNPVSSMYDTDLFTKYWFNCKAVATYTTSAGIKRMEDTSNSGELIIDYDIFLNHNGVNVYEDTNTINGTTVTDTIGINNATQNKTYSIWKYPHLSIIEPRHINTVLVQFASQTFDSRDSIKYDSSYASSIGVSATGGTKYVTFTANTKNTVTTEQWEELLRRIEFTTYDSMQVTADGIVGGVKVYFNADENTIPKGTFYNPANGHMYQYISGNQSLWTAMQYAKSTFNERLGSYGYPVHINDKAENDYLVTILDGHFGMTGAARGSDGVWRWMFDWDHTWNGIKSNRNELMTWNSTFKISGTGQSTHLHINGDGTWECYDGDIDNVCGGGAVIEWEGNADPTKNVSDTDWIGTQVKTVSPPVVANTTTIAGTVWAENDRDGIYQTGDEATVEGVSVILHNEDGSVSATTKTNKYGNYSFGSIAPNLKFYVEFSNGTSNIKSYTPTLKGAASENNSRVNGNWCSDVFTAVYQKNSVNTVNCGVFVPSTMSGFVWDDSNRDGIYNNNEAKLKNANITVLTDDGSAAYDVYGNQVTGIKTDASGNYSISNLKPRQTYTIKVLSATGSNLANARVSQLPGSTADKAISNKATKITSVLGTSGRPSGAYEGVGETFSGAEIRSIYMPSMSGNSITPVSVQYQNVALYVNHGISGYVWAESDYNGVFDGFNLTSTNAKREPAVGSITVNLKNENGDVVKTTVTDTAGYYQFVDVLEGNYTLEFVNSDGVVVEGRETGRSAGLYDFEVSPKAKSYYKAPGNDTTGVTENGVLMAAVSDKFTVPMVALAQASGDTDAYVVNENCGLYVPSYIHGQVWADGNKDGQKDNTESRIKGVKVSLVTSDGKEVKDVYGNKVQPIITGDDGKYTFRSIPVGTYRVDIDNGDTDISEFTVTKFRADGVDESVNNDARNGEGGIKASIDWVEIKDLNDNTFKTDAANKNFTGKINHDQSTVFDMDAGLIRAQSISGLVWAERDYNMRRDDGEERIAGITVKLLDQNNNVATDSNGKPLTTKTDANGEYSFIDLPNGIYRVAVFKSTLQPVSNYKAVQKWMGKAAPSNDPKVSNFDADFNAAPDGAAYADYISAQTFDFTGNITDKSALKFEHIDFGFYIQHGVNGKVWLDENGNGTIDKDETPIPNVTVSITNKDGSPVDDLYGNKIKDVTTDENGDYSFSLVPNGDFVITVKNGDTIIDHFEVSPKQNDNKATGTPNDDGILEKADADVTMTETSTDEEVNVGLTANRTIYGISFIDYNSNGEREEADDVISNILVSLKAKDLLSSTPKDVYGNEVKPVFTDEIEFPDGTTAIGYKFEHLKAGEYDVVFDGKDNTDIRWEDMSSTVYHATGVDTVADSDTKDNKVLLSNKLNTSTAVVSAPLFETVGSKQTYENGHVDNGLITKLAITKEANKPEGTILAPGQSLIYTITVETTSTRDDFTVVDELPNEMKLVGDVHVTCAEKPDSVIARDSVTDGTVKVEGPFYPGKTTITYAMVAKEVEGGTFAFVYNKATTIPNTPDVPGEPYYPETPETEHLISDGGVGDFTKTVALVDSNNNVGDAKTGSVDEPIVTNIYQTLEYTLQFRYNQDNPLSTMPLSLESVGGGNSNAFLSGEVVVTDPLPNGTTYIKKSTSIHFSDGSTAKLKSFKRDATNSLIWTFDKLAPNEVVTIKFRVYAPVTSDDPTTAEYETSKVFENKATLLDLEKEYKLYDEDVTETLPDGTTIEHKKGDRVYPNGEALIESNSTYNIVKEPRIVGVKAIEGKKSGDKVSAGEELTYTITLTNNGEIGATNVVLKDPIPGHSKFVSASNDGVFDFDSDMVTWDIGNLAVGESKEVQLVVKIGSTTQVDKLIINAASYTYQPEDQTGENNPPEKTPTIPGKTNEVVSKLDGNPLFPTPDHNPDQTPSTTPEPNYVPKDNPNKPNVPGRPGVYTETVISKAAAAISGITSIPRTGTTTNGVGTEETATAETAQASGVTVYPEDTVPVGVIAGIAIVVIGAVGFVVFKKKRNDDNKEDINTENKDSET